MVISSNLFGETFDRPFGRALFPLVFELKIIFVKSLHASRFCASVFEKLLWHLVIVASALCCALLK